MDRRWGLALIAAGLVAAAALRVAAVHTTAFHWDELNLLWDVWRSADEGVLHSSGHPGLPQVLLLGWVEGCQDEIATARGARLAWLALTWVAIAGLFALVWQLLPSDSHRLHDSALITALYALAPVILEWSLQVRTDQVALAGGTWGAAALLASRRRPALAGVAGALFGLGLLGSEKVAYLGALAALLAAGEHLARGAWRPRRELARAALASAAALAVWLAWRAYLGWTFDLPPAQATLAPVSVERVDAQLEIFRFYRSTIGFSQYVAALPGLIPQLALLAATALAALLSARARTSRLTVAAAVLALGVGVGAFHASAFGYFLMTLGVFVAAALALTLPLLRSALAPRWGEAVRIATPVLWAAVLGGGLLHGLVALHDTQEVQRESLRFVHRNFAPERAGFHPESGLFCGMNQPFGTWFAPRLYRSFESELREQRSERLIARFRTEPVHYLLQSFRLNQFPAPVRRFWAEHYQPYRASVFVAGRQVDASDPGSLHFELIVPGPYRWLPVAGDPSLELDGATLAPGAVAHLDAGPHRVRLESGGARGLLVLALADPPGPAPLPFYPSW